MGNRINCPNGHVLAVGPEHEGKRIKCPKCHAVLEVPIMTAVEVPRPLASAEAPAPSAKATAKSTAKPPPLPPRIDQDEEAIQERPSRRSESNDNEAIAERP